MAKPKIWQRRQNGAWYVTINPEQILLGRDKDEAKAEYDRLMGANPNDLQRVDDLLDTFLGWVDRNLSASTFKSYRDHLRSFNNSVRRGLRLCDLKPYHVSQWLDKQETWNTTTKNGAVRALKRSLNWAVEQGLISHSPIARFKAPPRRNRETLITREMWPQIGRIVKDQEFRNLLMILRTTGWSRSTRWRIALPAV